MAFGVGSPAFWSADSIPPVGLEFNGSNEDIGVSPNARLLNSANANQFVMEFILQRRNTVATLQRMFDLFDANGMRMAIGTQAVGGGVPANPGDLYLAMRDFTGVFVVRKEGVLPNALTEDTWHHLVIAYSLSGPDRFMTVYLNNVDTTFPAGSWTATTDSDLAAFADEDYGIKFGNTNTDASFAEMGLLIAAIWFQNGVTSAQVAALFNNPLKDRRTTFGDYTAAMRDVLAHYWAPSKDQGNISSMCRDYGLVGVARNLSGLATNMGPADLVIPYP